MRIECVSRQPRGRRSLIAAIAMLSGIAFLSATAAAQIYRLPNPAEKPGDFFGVSVAIEGSRAVVGASASDGCGENSGAAHVYEADSTTGHWNHTATLAPEDCMADDYFGRSIDMSGDRILVSAFRPAGLTNRPNAAYLFERDSSGTWSQVARFMEVPDRDEGAFAAAVAIDGDHAVVTTTGDGVDGKYHGAVYVYRPTSSGARTWHLTQRIVPTAATGLGVFGTSVAIQDSTMMVGASTYLAGRPGSVYFLRLDDRSGRWKIRHRFGGVDDFFLPVDLDGARAIAGERRAGGDGSGRATLFERDPNGDWSRITVLRPARPFQDGAFGSGVALGRDRALVVGFDEQLRFEFNIDRVVYVFEPVTSMSWRQRHIVDVGEVSFGSDVAVDGSVALIGQAADARPGTAYVVQLH